MWFVGKLRDRIILSTLRRLVVKDATKSRYSFKYLFRDETVVAYIAGGIDAFIKLSRDWPFFWLSIETDISQVLTSCEGDFIKFPVQS
ncbi:hypothetical protein L6164_025223 [Bauhinia variegata]|uniref:Uncharacterized protein n=1 Tax=Bauhinia variegata TaxID=167791 RepID=A0ACB9M1Q8_BAUVA|nr:hypothetical protein L6164_025223 [Bauhinia variegata]